MEPRLTRGEYWLLETVVKQEFEVCALITRDLEAFLDKRGHGLTRSALVETLHRLLAAGHIYAKSEAGGSIATQAQIERALAERVPWDTHHVFVSADGDVELAPDTSKPPRTEPVDVRQLTYYGLTPEGGAHWEAFAAPNWEKYIAARSQARDETDESQTWEVICADADWLEMYIDSLCFYSQIEVSPASIAWDEIAPWQATYWKQLEGAHRVRFQARNKHEADLEPFPPPDRQDFARVWYAWQ